MNSEMGAEETNVHPGKGPLTRLLTWGPAAAIMALIFRLSSESSFGGPGWITALAYRVLGDWAGLARFDPLLKMADDYASWGAHFVLYGALALALFWALRREWPTFAHPMWMAWLLAVLYGLSDELHQFFVPGRHADWRDIATDMAGAATALGLFHLLRLWLGDKVRGGGRDKVRG